MTNKILHNRKLSDVSPNECQALRLISISCCTDRARTVKKQDGRPGHASFARNSFLRQRYHWQNGFTSINQVQLRALAAGETISLARRREATVNILWRISCNEMHHFLLRALLVSRSLVKKALLYGNFAAFELKGAFYDVNSEGRTLPGE